jgi:hypothetical protein
MHARHSVNYSVTLQGVALILYVPMHSFDSIFLPTKHFLHKSVLMIYMHAQILDYVYL